LQQAVVMGTSVLFVVALGNVVVSLLRNLIPDRIRIIIQLVAAASLVIIVNEILKAFLPDMAEALSVFVGLIITNCILMGRYEAFAMMNKPWPSFLDGIGNSLGYVWILLVVSLFREVLGAGKFWGIEIFGSSVEKTGLYAMGYANNNLIVLAPFALFCVAIIIWVQRSVNKSLIEQ
jgi:Na+-transporting NADH:ubiquinone oxidoreductase subunit D